MCWKWTLACRVQWLQWYYTHNASKIYIWSSNPTNQGHKLWLVLKKRWKLSNYLVFFLCVLFGLTSVIGDLSVPLTAALPIRTIQKNSIIMDVITLHWLELPFIPIKSYSGAETRLEGPFFYVSLISRMSEALWLQSRHLWRSVMTRCNSGLFVSNKRPPLGFMERQNDKMRAEWKQAAPAPVVGGEMSFGERFRQIKEMDVIKRSREWPCALFNLIKKIVSVCEMYWHSDNCSVCVCVLQIPVKIYWIWFFIFAFHERTFYSLFDFFFTFFFFLLECKSNTALLLQSWIEIQLWENCSFETSRFAFTLTSEITGIFKVRRSLLNFEYRTRK